MRLIDADTLPKYTGTALSAVDVARAVEAAPTIDPVKHGEWVRYKKTDADGEYFEWCECSVCREVATQGNCFFDLETPWCPWCGAKMYEDGGEDGQMD